MSQPEQLLNQGKAFFHAKDYEACISIIHELLLADPANAEAAFLLKQAQTEWEEQRSLEELEIYVENLKKEAMDLFDKEEYEQCQGMFRYLVELEPGNHTLREYLKLTEQMVSETREAQKQITDSRHSNTSVEVRQYKESTDKTEEMFSSAPAQVDSQFPVCERDSQATPIPDEKHRHPDSLTSIPGAHTPKLTPDDYSLTRPIAEAVKQRMMKDQLGLEAHTKPRRGGIVLWLAAAAVLLFIVTIALRWWLSSVTTLTGSLDVQSNPEGANVFINDELEGQTHLRRDGIPVGNYDLRLEKEGCFPYRQKFTLKGGQASTFLIQLQPREPAFKPMPQPTLVKPEANDQEQDLQPLTMASSVIHNHRLGNCTGRLRIAGDTISFSPSGDSKDGFTRKLSQIELAELGDKLMIQFRDRTYHFEALARSKEEGQRKLSPIYQHIKKQI